WRPRARARAVLVGVRDRRDARRVRGCAAMRILFSVPAFGPAQAFGGPVEVVTRLAEGLVARGHAIDIFTTSLVDLGTGRSLRSRVESAGGARVRYLATPLRFRW